MGYYDYPAKRPATEPPPFDPNTQAATAPPPFDPTSAYAQQVPAQQAPLAGNYDTGPMLPAQVPPEMTAEGLRRMLTERQAQGGRPMGGYYAQPSAGDALAQALMAIRQNNAPRR